MPSTSAFRFVSGPKLRLINAKNVRGLAPPRQLQAIRKWWEMNLAKDPRFALESDEDMQAFLKDAANELGVDTAAPPFGTALAAQKGAGEAWREKVEDTTGKAVDIDAQGLDDQVLGKLKEIVTDRGRGDHGDTQLSGNNGNHKHWRAGDLRIFGTMKANGNFIFVGVGRHSGQGNSHYKLDLVTGGTCTADT